MINCCYKCEKRQAGCHSSCATYISAKKLHDEQRERARQADKGRRIFEAMEYDRRKAIAKAKKNRKKA